MLPKPIMYFLLQINVCYLVAILYSSNLGI